MAEVLKCSCSHAFQDKEYGSGKRVHNSLPKEKDREQMYRCSVCGKERGRGGDEPRVAMVIGKKSKFKKGKRQR